MKVSTVADAIVLSDTEQSIEAFAHILMDKSNSCELTQMVDSA